jgi:hypothetical protein
VLARFSGRTAYIAGGKKMPNLNSRRWTADDIATLRNLARKYPAAAIARQLGRSAAATALKAHELKLSLRIQKPKAEAAETPLVVDPGPCGMDLRE